ncbi:2-oxoglutarate dehydrogenase E1 component [Oceanobacillus neutriphilus]|uniref:2-oxoglutarate dehydrogenase E1 component n=1 Tax=Oceanobacillus neutriphilus TaxID=531815 RepID=A0ABQ2NT13_9BACI|nr:2-oxoglutarate dehydrogenase E1 component [Oceanobacillus neutriphilus]GGP09471.1 2-oxoglutarate dehydrogenase E1 component [Oceanobacillus neutriphilus]
MPGNEESAERFWGQFHGQNAGYLEQQYELYREDPEQVESSIKSLFDTHGAPAWMTGEEVISPISNEQTAFNAGVSENLDVTKLTSAIKLVEAIRRYGHTDADIYSVGGYKSAPSQMLSLKHYGLTEEDLKKIPASWIWEREKEGVETGLDVINLMKKYYTGTITFEYDHVNNDDERTWLFDLIEEGNARFDPDQEERKDILRRLSEVEGFEKFLHKTFVGQKRFSIEGLESMIPMIDFLVKYANEDNIEHVMMGMAHRGRLAVLANVLKKPYDKIFSEFNYTRDKELMPSEGSKAINYGWTGDVKYHFGAEKEVIHGSKVNTKITLAHNPSHLEFVNPVVEGFARAAQDEREVSGYPARDINKSMPLVIHGDAAFIGEGVVAETLNLSGLPGYTTGGTVHLIANNQLGYTTDRVDGRSTRYASDLAKGFEIPIIRVSADDPISCISAIKIACEYRKKFHKDILIDLVGYRRYGHNEMDEPRTTQPQLYSEIDNHPSVATLFARAMEERKLLESGEFDEIKNEIETRLSDIYKGMTESEIGEPQPKSMPEVLSNRLDQFETAVDLENLQKINEELLERPEGFKGFKKTERILQRRKDALKEGNKADWGTGEALAFASILKDGTPIRLTGQDTERGTFAHRHVVLHDVETGEKYSPMHGLSDVKASFDVRNSPLSETAVLGFEYGYSVYSPNTLVIWEAQFGDFANAGQVIIDQFIASARAKWNEKSNMVLLLPHGYEGQGPEHSSARLERYLQMAAENNWIVANVTSSAQLFHLLRRQAAMRSRPEARPLILMTPKSSLIRDYKMASSAEEFTSGGFKTLREQPYFDTDPEKTTRLLLGSGKIMIDIEGEMEEAEEACDWIRALRVEQIYPFPKKAIQEEIKKLPHLKEIVWVQEEPKNMGSWDFVDDYLRELLEENQELHVISRPKRAAPAGGIPTVHKTAHKYIIDQALSEFEGGKSSAGN